MDPQTKHPKQSLQLRKVHVLAQLLSVAERMHVLKSHSRPH